MNNKQAHILILLLCFCCIMLALSGCAKRTLYFDELPIFNGITKGDILWDGGESTPIIFGGELYYIAVGVGNPYTLDVRNKDGLLLYRSVSHLEYISAFVDAGVVYVVGSPADKRSLQITTSTDLINWSAQREVISGGGNKFYNSSITKTNDGFVMAYEICNDNIHCFNVQFLKTYDFVNWQPIGQRIFNDTYTACPTLRYVDGYYYVLFTAHFPFTLVRDEYWATYISRSADLVNWEHGRYQVLSPRDKSEGAPNASDMDFVEHDGVLKIIYLNTPQITRGTYYNVGSRAAVYNGTLKQFLEEQF